MAAASYSKLAIFMAMAALLLASALAQAPPLLPPAPEPVGPPTPTPLAPGPTTPSPSSGPSPIAPPTHAPAPSSYFHSPPAPPPSPSTSSAPSPGPAAGSNLPDNGAASMNKFAASGFVAAGVLAAVLTM